MHINVHILLNFIFKNFLTLKGYMILYNTSNYFVKIGIICIIVFRNNIHYTFTVMDIMCNKDNTKGVKTMFETKRLLIRPYVPKDANVLLETIGKYEIYKTTYGIPYPCDIKYSKKWIKNVINNALENRAYEYAVIRKIDGRYIGNVGLINIDFANHKCDISYFVDPIYWGNGIATEASAQLIEYAFNVLNMNRVGGTCMEHNIASSRVMEKLLMSYEGTARGYFIKDNEYVNLKIYSIMKNEFYKYYNESRENVHNMIL